MAQKGPKDRGQQSVLHLPRNGRIIAVVFRQVRISTGQKAGKGCRFHRFYGNAMALPWHCHGKAMALTWHCHRNAMALPLQSDGVAMPLPWQCHGIAMALPLQCHGTVNMLCLKILISWGSFKRCQKQIYNYELIISFAGQTKTIEFANQ